jgi:hypothetical protein
VEPETEVVREGELAPVVRIGCHHRFPAEAGRRRDAWHITLRALFQAQRAKPRAEVTSRTATSRGMAMPTVETPSRGPPRVFNFGFARATRAR